VSPGPKFAEHVGRVDEVTSFNIGVGVAEGLMQRTTVSVVEPVARVQGLEFHLGPFGQIAGLINDRPNRPNACLQSHRSQATTARAAQPLAADAGRCDYEPPRLKRRR
jgi:hypothetical protein